MEELSDEEFGAVAFKEDLWRLGEEEYARRFAAFPAVAQLAEGRAVAHAREFVDELGIQGGDDPELQQSLEASAKKVFFIFTNPEDLEDSLSDDDFRIQLMNFYVGSDRSMQRTANTFREFANLLLGHAAMAESAAGWMWQNMDASSRSWFVLGTIGGMAMADLQRSASQDGPEAPGDQRT